MKAPFFLILSSLYLPVSAPVWAGASETRQILISGEVIAKNAQSIFIPQSYNGQAVIRYFLPEGSPVKTGDVILRIDSSAQNDIEQLEIGLQQSQQRVIAEQTKLNVASLEAQKQFLIAKTTLAKAEIDALLPKGQISALDFDKYQGEKARAERDLQVKQHALSMAREAQSRAQQDAALEHKKLSNNLQFQRQLLSRAEVKANQSGIVTHAYSNNTGERIEQGSTADIGELAGHVIGDGAMHIKAWAIEADRHKLKTGMPVKVSIDALPGTSFNSKIDYISQAPEERKRWGKARYFQLDIGLANATNLPLVAGMSVLIEPLAANASDLNKVNFAPTKPNINSKPITAEGEILSRRNYAVIPPSVPYTWQYSLQQIGSDGSSVKSGEVITRFQTSDLQNKINTIKSSLNEKMRALDKLKLDHQEADKNSQLIALQASSEAEKAARKASMPKELIRRVDYDKLVLEKNLQAELAQLAETIRDAEIQSRKAERATVEADIKLNQEKLRQYTEGQGSLTIRAPFSGVFNSKTSYNGEKFTSGSQVWLGMTVANLADPQQLYVRAQIPEVQSIFIKPGQLAQVSLNGANQTLNAKVIATGQVYHSKSQAQPQVVRDIELEFSDGVKNLKPGSMVQVIFPATPPAAASRRL